MNMTKGLVISFHMCRDKIGWLYEYNNTKWLKYGWRFGHIYGIVVISIAKLCYIDSCNFDLVGYMFGYNYKSVG